MKPGNKKLGRGLAALLPGHKKNTKGNETNFSHQALELEISLIKKNRKQPRENFNQEALQELAASIKEQGVLQPIIVRKKDNGYELVAGERRTRAAALAGLKKIPAVIAKVSDDRLLETALVENLQRENLNAIEIAQSYQTLINDLNLKHEDVAKRLGISRASVTNMLRLLQLPREIRENVSRGTISMGHARALLAVNTMLDQIAINKRIIKDSLSVRETEHFIRGLSQKPLNKKKPEQKKKNKGAENVLQDYEDKLRQHFGTKVKINDNSGKGHIVIEYYSNSDLGRVLELLGLDN